MEFQKLFDTYSPLVKKFMLPIVLATLGMTFFAYGLIVLLGNSKSASDGVVFQSGSKAVEAAKTVQTIAIDVEGAVIKPGLYNLPIDARIKDLLVISGGLSAKADRNYVAKNINLAQKVTDGGKIYIPFAGETVPPVNNSTGNTQASGALININTASEQELDSLPGIGPVTAAKIINSRPYGTVNELLDKKVVGSKVFTDIKDKIGVY